MVVPKVIAAGLVTLVMTGDPTVTSPVKRPLVITGSTGPRIALATAPFPLSQASLIIILGGVIYPPPGVTISIPKRVVAAVIIAFPFAPLPPPPENSIVGGPHSLGPTLQSPSEEPNLVKVSAKSKLKLKVSRSISCPAASAAALNASLAALALDTSSFILKVTGGSAPLTEFHSFTSVHLGSSSH